MLDPTEAARTIIDVVRPLPSEDVPIADALDRVLATDVKSPIDLPPWDNSAMDGYAVRSDDVRGRCPVDLEIIQEVPAGVFPALTVGPGQCARVFTGAPIPGGTDAVIRQEDTSTPIARGGIRRVRIETDRDVGRNVRHKGEDLQSGSLVLSKGTLLGPAHIGVLASIACVIVPAYRQPRVAILSSGDEIADLDEREAILSGTKVASSNSYTLMAMSRRAGAVPVCCGIARDDPQDLRDRLANLGQADLLVTSGGVSVGEHDHLRAVLEDMGADIKFWRVRMRPGAPIAFGLLRDLPWFGLPGNPVSAMVTFELFVRPAIRAMMGLERPFRRTVQVRITEPVELQTPRRHFMRVQTAEIDGQRVAKLTGAQGSGILSSMAQADALLVVPENRQRVAAGETLDAMLLDETVHVKEVPF